MKRLVQSRITGEASTFTRDMYLDLADPVAKPKLRSSKCSALTNLGYSKWELQSALPSSEPALQVPSQSMLLRRRKHLK